MEKTIVDQKDDIIDRYPDMVLVPVDLYFRMEKRSRIQVLFFFIVTTILSLFLGVHFGYSREQLSGVLLSIGMEFLILSIIYSIAISFKFRKWRSIQRRVNGHITHIELDCQYSRSLRRVYKNGKYGLVTESSFWPVLPIQYYEIAWVCGGTYLTVLDEGDIPVKFDEESGF